MLSGDPNPRVHGGRFGVLDTPPGKPLSNVQVQSFGLRALRAWPANGRGQRCCGRLRRFHSVKAPGRLSGIGSVGEGAATGFLENQDVAAIARGDAGLESQSQSPETGRMALLAAVGGEANVVRGSGLFPDDPAGFPLPDWFKLRGQAACWCLLRSQSISEWMFRPRLVRL